MKRFLNWKLPVIILSSLLMLVFNVPSQYQPEFMPDQIQNAEINLGLDLQGGSQLDYKVDLRNVPEKDQDAIVDGILEVINKRVNGLGVAEPNIYTSKVGEETHIIVELAGIKDLEEAKASVGKTIQLEFKEQNTEIDDTQVEEIKAQADALLEKIQADPDQFEVLAGQEALAYPSRVSYEETELQFKDEMTGDIIPDRVFSSEAGTVIPEVIEDNIGFVYDDTTGQINAETGYFLVKVLEKKDNVERTTEIEKEVSASHILIAYEGAERAGEDVTRTKEEAKELADQILARLKGGEDFAATAKEFSDEPGADTSGGKLSSPVKYGGDYVLDFTNAALELDQEGEITDYAVETEFGYHIIKADSITPASTETTVEPQARVARLFFSTKPDPWKTTQLTGQFFERADVQFDQYLNPQVGITFDTEGAKLFEEITSRNINKPVAIFVGGELISAPIVQQAISGGQAVINGNFTADEADKLARDLNTGAIPAPITLSGQYTIGASLGQQALTQSLEAGLIGLGLLLIYMLLYYRLPGLFANIALVIYSVILMFLIKVEIPLSYSLLISIAIYMGVVTKIVNNREPFFEKTMSFLVASFALFFIAFLLSNAVVLTLAGVAGIILSIGMAVDANVLIFERIKEEIRDGRDYKSAVEIGFERAWSSIRDSNFSSLITTAILYYFGTSIIKGFALNLAIGILISMFTAITVTRSLMLSVNGEKLMKNKLLMGFTKHKREKPFRIMSKTKIWMALSGTVIVVALVSLFSSGIKTGIDFEGGTLIDVQFPAETEVQISQIAESLNAVEASLVNTNAVAPDAVAVDEETEVLTEAPSETTTSLGSPTIISSGDNAFQLRMAFVDEPTRDKIVDQLEADISSDLEITRFSSIGPLISNSLKEKARVSLLIALVAIILYIGFAFRNIPKGLSPWKFGFCAIIALVHDVLITLGIFALFKIEIDVLFITALLTIIGFSVHDTIVVFDRIRENLRDFDPKKDKFADVCDTSLTQTMARSINTSFSTLLTLMMLIILGSSSITYFIFALVIGIFIGTYSSVFIASPILNWMIKRSKVRG